MIYRYDLGWGMNLPGCRDHLKLKSRLVRVGKSTNTVSSTLNLKNRSMGGKWIVSRVKNSVSNFNRLLGRGFLKRFMLLTTSSM
jgi:hypothetical protein